jgi:ParB-like nuclease domain
MGEPYTTHLLTLNEVAVPPERLRSLDKEKVERIAASIKEIGLQNPISVRRPHDREYRLVAGLHRLEAMRLLGENMILAGVMTCDDTDARLWEISENLDRAELTPDERRAHTEAWKVLVGRSRGRSKLKGGTFLPFPRGAATRAGIKQLLAGQASTRRPSATTTSSRSSPRTIPTLPQPRRTPA